MEHFNYTNALLSLLWVLGSILVATYIWRNEHKHADSYPSRWFTVAYVMAAVAAVATIGNLPHFTKWNAIACVAVVVGAVAAFLKYFRRKEKCYWMKFGPHQNLQKIIVALFLFLTIQALGMVVSMVIGEVTGGSHGPHAGSMLDTAEPLGLFLGDLLIVWFFHQMGWLHISWGSIGKADRRPVALMMVVLGIGFIILTGYLEELSNLTDELEHEFELMEHNVFGVLSICLVGPIAEEVCDRGIIMGALLTWTKRPWVAIVGSALIFGISHMNPIQIFSASIAGILLGWLYYRTGSLLPGIIVHILNNSISTASHLLLGRDYELPSAWMDVVLCAVGGIVFYVSLQWSRRKFSTYVPLSDADAEGYVPPVAAAPVVPACLEGEATMPQQAPADAEKTR